METAVGSWRNSKITEISRWLFDPQNLPVGELTEILPGLVTVEVRTAGNH